MSRYQDLMELAEYFEEQYKFAEEDSKFFRQKHQEALREALEFKRSQDESGTSQPVD